MFRLALHWQILIGMIAGSLIGLGLNLTASTRTVTVSQGLPADIAQSDHQRLVGSDRNQLR